MLSGARGYFSPVFSAKIYSSKNSQQHSSLFEQTGIFFSLLAIVNFLSIGFYVCIGIFSISPGNHQECQKSDKF